VERGYGCPLILRGVAPGDETRPWAPNGLGGASPAVILRRSALKTPDAIPWERADVVRGWSGWQGLISGLRVVLVTNDNHSPLDAAPNKLRNPS